MPRIRRSNRIQSKNSKQKSDNSKNEPSINSTVVEVETESETEQETQKCIACKQRHPPIRRYTQTNWIQCDNCDHWWHIECACVTKEDNDRLTRYKINYSCAICVLKGSPWITSNQDLPQLVESNVKKVEDCNAESRIKVSEKSCPSLPEFEEKQIIIVDNLANAQAFRSSVEIENQIKSKEIEGVQFSYSLPKGGVALQFKDKEKAEKALKEWPTRVFHEKEVPHYPRGIEGVKIGFLKNVNLRLQESEIKSELFKNGISVKEVKRCYHRQAGVRMPVAKLFFKSYEDLQNACHKKIVLSYRGRQAFIEPQRRNTIVRCYNCMRYSHIAANCTFEIRCETCGETGHTERDCKNPVKCANCKEEHKASSKQCPVFKEKLKEINKRRILQ